MITALKSGSTIIDAGGRLTTPRLKSAHRIRSDAFSDWFNPCGIVDGKFVNLAPDEGAILQEDIPGGRAGLYDDTGFTDIEIIYTWTGIRHQQGAPLACINEDDPAFGLGVWIETEIVPPASIVVVWQLGRQPSDIYLPVASEWLEGDKWFASGPTYTEGRHYEIKMRVKGDKMKGFIDGVEYVNVTIPEGLRGSTVHGMSLDVNSMDNLPSGRQPNADCGLAPYQIREIPENEPL